MIEPTDEMQTAYVTAFIEARRTPRREGYAELDGLAAVLAIVERDNHVRHKLAPEALQCGHRRHGMDCQLPPAHYGNHGHSTWTAWS